MGRLLKSLTFSWSGGTIKFNMIWELGSYFKSWFSNCQIQMGLSHWFNDWINWSTNWTTFLKIFKLQIAWTAQPCHWCTLLSLKFSKLWCAVEWRSYWEPLTCKQDATKSCNREEAAVSCPISQRGIDIMRDRDDGYICQQDSLGNSLIHSHMIDWFFMILVCFFNSSSLLHYPTQTKSHFPIFFVWVALWVNI